METKNNIKNFNQDLLFFDETSNEIWDKLLVKNKCFYRYNSSNAINYYKEYFSPKKNLTFILISETDIIVNILFEMDLKLIFFIPFVKSIKQNNPKNKSIKFYKNLLKYFNNNNKVEFFYPPKINSNTDNMLFLFSSYYKLGLMYEMFIDLENDINEIWGSLRSSFKSLVNKQKDKLKIIVSYDMSDFDELKKLHVKVSNRQTRSDMTWEIQKQNLELRSGVMFKLLEENTVLGMSFFTFDSEFAYYDIGVYDRNKFGEIGISHKLLWEAINYFKKMSLSALYLGNTISNSDKKLSNIIKFKSGFSNMQRLSCYIEK